MSYKGFSFNLHKEDDKELISWLSNKKITRTIKIALYNQMKSENNIASEDNPMELLSAIKRVIENNDNGNIAKTDMGNKEVPAPSKNKEEGQSLSGEDADDFEKIFDV